MSTVRERRPLEPPVLFDEIARLVRAYRFRRAQRLAELEAEYMERLGRILTHALADEASAIAPDETEACLSADEVRWLRRARRGGGAR
jgi:hypothetical protein